MLIKIIVMLFVLVTASCFPVKHDVVPFKTEESYMVISKDKSPINTGDLFSYQLAIETVQPMRNIIIRVELPKEVYVKEARATTLSGNQFDVVADEKIKFIETERELVWKGELVPDEKTELLFLKSYSKKRQQLHLLLISKTDGRKWSEPIKGSIEFDYDPLKKMHLEGYVDVKAGHYQRSFSATYEKWMPKGT